MDAAPLPADEGMIENRTFDEIAIGESASLSHRLLVSLNGMTAPRTPFRGDLEATVCDLAASAASLRGFARSVERDPSALLTGRAAGEWDHGGRAADHATVLAGSAAADGEVVLVARWSITDGGACQTLASGRVSLTEPTAGKGDGAVVTAMTRVTDLVANRIAAGLERTSAAARGSR